MNKIERVAKSIATVDGWEWDDHEIRQDYYREHAMVAIEAIDALNAEIAADESDLATIAYMSGAADARNTIKALRARIAKIEAAAKPVLDDIEAWRHEKILGGCFPNLYHMRALRDALKED